MLNVLMHHGMGAPETGQLCLICTKVSKSSSINFQVDKFLALYYQSLYREIPVFKISLKILKFMSIDMNTCVDTYIYTERNTHEE